MDQEKMNQLVDCAVEGDVHALEELLSSVQDMIFNLSLRMLGSIADAEDASQDIIIRIMTNLSSFRKESSFSTWAYRLSVNYLMNYKKSMFAQHPLNFEFYGHDIVNGTVDETEKLVDDMCREELAEELKMSCTNVMLQCLDAESRCIFILGTMFKIDSRTAGEILEMSPENYRQKLSRIRKKMGEFLEYYCGLTQTGICCCKNRVDYAISQKRIDPKKKEYLSLEKLNDEKLMGCKNEMEKLDEMSLVFEDMPDYKSTVNAMKIARSIIESSQMNKIKQY